MKLFLLQTSILCLLATACLSLQERPATRPPSRPASEAATRGTAATEHSARAAPAAETKESHLEALRAKLPHEGFTVVWQAPFAVVGDEPRTDVERRAVGTVKWAVDMLKREYFEKDPEQILDVWLFKDEASYLKHTREVFGDEPTTPYGYYSPRHRALIMNIGTGGGTLVHEIVHPFVAANFPDCPAWFNEGLGSLYEQSDERNGRIVGLTNWRLKGLQQAIRADQVPSFERLTGTTSAEFYGKESGVHYAAARYLLYWLQEKDLLRRFYREFREHRAQDPSGYQTLKKVLSRDDLDAFQEEWKTFVLDLRFPP